jgi:hypothetical protein
MSLGTIFDNRHFILSAQAHESAHVSRHAIKVYDQERFYISVLLKDRLCCCRRHIAGFRRNICENRPGSAIENAVGGRDKTEWRREHLIALFDAAGKKRRVQSGRTVRGSNAMFGAAITCKRLFKSIDIFTAGKDP